MEIETLDRPTKYMSFLSEDDDDKTIPSVVTPDNKQQFINQEYIIPLESIKISSTIPPINTNVLPQSPLVPEDPFSNVEVEKISENNQDSLLTEEDQTTSSVPINILDSNRIEIVLRLLHFLTQSPIPLKRLRLIRRRIQQKQIPEEQLTISTVYEEIPTTVTEITRYADLEQLESTEKSDTMTTEISDSQVSLPFEEHLESTEESDITITEIPEDQVVLPMEEPSQSTEESNTPIHDTLEDLVSILMEEPSQSTEESNTPIHDTLQDPVSIPMEEPLKSIEESHNIIQDSTTVDEIREEQSDPSVEHSLDGKLNFSKMSNHRFLFYSLEQSTITEEPSMISSSQESAILTPPVLGNQYFFSFSFLIFSFLEIPKQSSLKPPQILVIHRLLHTLTILPVKPLILPIPFPLKKRKRKAVVKKPSVTLSRQPSTRISRSPTRMQTRSLNSIRACISRCNQPKTATPKKRTAAEVISSSPPPPSNTKRRKSTRIEQNTNEYDLIKKFINSFSKEINDELRKIIEQKLIEDISLFNENFYQIISELIINKCDIILPLVKNLHPYEESIKILLTYINSKSSIFQQHFFTKLNQSFEYEIKQQQQQISNNRIKILK